MPCCRRTGTALPASLRVCSPARLPAAGDGLPRCRGAGTAVPASSPGGKGGKRATRGGLKKGKPGTAGRWETREMQEVRGAREKRETREAGDKQTAQRESLCAVPFSDICPACPVAAGQEPPCPQAVGCARPRGCPPPGVGDGISRCRPGGKRGKREEDTGRLRRYRRAAPRRLPKVSAPSPQRLTSASVSHSAGSLPSPVSGTGSAVTRSVNTGLLVVPNAFVASQ